MIVRTGPLPTLIEWDNDVPAWPVLRSEAVAADAVLTRFGAMHAA
ncbi:MAG: multinuclear nonheme iron-dependent oxidase [Rhodoplanes sp.]